MYLGLRLSRQRILLLLGVVVVAERGRQTIRQVAAAVLVVIKLEQPAYQAAQRMR
jgi:hypothetical protein